jgi:hypothetical protein
LRREPKKKPNEDSNNWKRMMHKISKDMRAKFLIITFVNLFIILAFVYHEKFLTALDEYIMPNSAELCKVVPLQLSRL